MIGSVSLSLTNNSYKAVMQIKCRYWEGRYRTKEKQQYALSAVINLVEPFYARSSIVGMF